jgi:hypothetical protein
MRTLQSGDEIIPDSKINIVIVGQSQPLLGNEELTGNEIKAKLSELLKRRGYMVQDDSNDYKMTFSYKTEKATEFKIESSVQAFSGSRSGMGVSLARAVAVSGVQAKQSIKNTSSFNHTVSAEIYDNLNKLIWKGESIWNTQDPDILGNFTPTLRMLLSSLPADTSIIPTILEIKRVRAINYYRMELENKTLSCPALPYSITFGSANNVEWNQNGASLPHCTVRYQDINALAAFLDLAETAEYALPMGNYNWEDMLNRTLWSKVVLGAEYKFSDSDKTVKILINLTGHTKGYDVDKCWVATDTEFHDFQLKLAVWKKALSEYHDIYK